MDVEIAYKIEEMKKNGATDREVGEKLGFSEKEILYARKVLGIRSRISGGGKMGKDEQPHVPVGEGGGVSGKRSL